jgi:Mor family transcriptional regulator
MDLNQVQGLLPENVRDMAQRIGLPATLVVIDRLGGTTWRVAEGRNVEGTAKRTALADLVGRDIEELLHREYAGEELYLARCHTALVYWRNLEINARFVQGVREGVTARTIAIELAREYSLSERWIWRIVKQHYPDTVEQGQLFH